MLTSVLLPVYNGSKYIKSAIESILKQKSDFEVIVQNDCSSDHTEDIVRSLNDKRVFHYSNQINCGVFKTLNKAAMNANGQLLRLFSHDDLMYENDLDTTEQYFRDNLSCMFSYCQFDKIDEHGIIYSNSKVNAPKLPYYINKAESPFILARYGCISGTQSNITIRRKAFDEIGGLNELMRISGDYDFVVRAAKHFGIHVNDNILCQIRFHQSQLSNMASDINKFTIRLSEYYTIGVELWSSVKPSQKRRVLLYYAKSTGYNMSSMEYKLLLKGDSRLFRRSMFHERFLFWVARNYYYITRKLSSFSV